jgi:acetyl/propionyl-CoA carboxylase alpha subunit/acetyl-CoA carboxylase carboxyltransferase component
MPDFTRIAIVNRGEAAMRFVHAVHELNREQRTALRAIALATEPDRRAMFVREADEVFDLGPATVVDERTGLACSAYVDLARLEAALRATRADAAWVGWGFVAEHAAFADLCARLGIVFIGPPAAAMRLAGDKISSKRLAETVGIPVVPWSRGPVATLAEARDQARRLGYPLMLKATASGGGRGIRVLRNDAELAAEFERAGTEAARAFGDGTLFLERLLSGSRHIEVQILGDRFGRVWALGVRDCTVQRRHQKVMEEAPCSTLTGAEDADLRAAAVRLTVAAGYENAGTVEFLFDPTTRAVAFMEVNARLQVEHPVTEMTTGLDLVKLQLHVARGGRLEGESPPTSGHAIEVRLNAEDPADGFTPAPGLIELLRLPAGPGVRVDRGVDEGDAIPSQFDSMIAKIIAFGRDRREALARLGRALGETAVVIRGGTTNRAFLLDLLERPEVLAGTADNLWLDRLAAERAHVRRGGADVALLHAAIEAYEAEEDIELKRFIASAARGRPSVRHATGHRVELGIDGHTYTLDVRSGGDERYRVALDGQAVAAHVTRLGRFERWLTTAGHRYRAVSVAAGPTRVTEVDGVSHRITRDEGGVVRAPAPAIVLSVTVAPGDVVAAGDRLAVLEAMKTEMLIVAPCAGRVRRVLVGSNVQVEAGAPLVVLEPSETGRSVAPGRVSFERLAESGCPTSLDETVARLRQLILGFDVEPEAAARLAADWERLRRDAAPDAAGQQAENDILATFVDTHALFAGRQVDDDPEMRGVPSAHESMRTYLRTLDAEAASLPGWFRERLRRALAHHGLSDLRRTPALERSLLRMWRSHQRVGEQVAAVLGILESRLGSRAAGTEEFRAILDRMSALTYAGHPELGDLARELRYRMFDRPLFEQARAEVYAEAEARLAALAGQLAPATQDAHMHWLVECPQPLVGLLSSRLAAAAPVLRRTMLEVLVRRYCRIRDLETVRTAEEEGRAWAVATYPLGDKRIDVLATHAPAERLADAARAAFPRLGALPREDDVVLDFFLWGEERPKDVDATAAAIGKVLTDSRFPRRLRRVDVAIASAGSSLGMGGMLHFTYRPQPDGRYVEERLYRGLHPMIGKRLHLWRLGNFAIERLPSVEDVYLFRGVAHSNPKDERLFALAEVRDLTPVRDADSRVVQLPHLERMLNEALAAIRLAQSHRSPEKRLLWNRVLLYIWPPLDLRLEELDGLVHKLAPATEGLGLEKVVIRVRIPEEGSPDELRDTVLQVTNPAGRGFTITEHPPTDGPIRPLSEYAQKVVRLRRIGLTYPYELLRMLTPPRGGGRAPYPPGEFVEHDLDAAGRLVPVDRAPGDNTANLVVGVIRNFTSRYPQGMARVALVADPSRSMGALAEPECRRIIAALDLAQQLAVPVEWFAVSAGARISMESGTENMDWIARVLRRLVEFTQTWGEVNVVVCGVNVGAQPYWNAEATMLMHTRGILVMTAEGVMVLTGKRALDYSGGVSAEDNHGIGGYDRIMGPNGQAQYWAPDVAAACDLLFRHYEHTYVAPGERFPRRAATSDPVTRDVRLAPHGDGFEHVGEVFSDIANPGRKRPFDIRRVMAATIDQDHPPLERWAAMRDAEVAVVWDAHLGGYPVCLIGIESRPLARVGPVPADGPEQWTAGTLFPRASKKVARALNAASGNRPVVVLANLSGFDGSPESMRELQLEYGAEIGRATVNFDGPIVFCVVSRYHGGAYVVFSRALNERLEAAALEGSYASVIGGAPAAAVVFAGELEVRTRRDPRVVALEREVAAAEGGEKARRRADLAGLVAAVQAEKLGEVAEEFDRVHSVERALRTRSLDRIIPAAELRPYLVDAIERGMRRTVSTDASLRAAAAH